jgi:predicted phage terminase large subunit-like protein
VLHWAKIVEAVLEATIIDVEETPLACEQRRLRLEADPEEWFAYYFPHYAYAPPAAFHKEATKRVLENPEWYEVRMWSRELAKSTRTMMEVLYLTLVGHKVNTWPLAPGNSSNANSNDLTLTTIGNKIIPLSPSTGLTRQNNNDSRLTTHNLRLKKRYILLVSNSLDNAVRLLMPYKANLECNRRIIQDYGIQEQAGTWQFSEFITQSGVAFRALGAGQSPRGARNEEVRPDVILFDDVDTDAECQNREMVAKRWRWIEEAAVGTRSISEPTTIIFCGNRIAVDCCVERATRLADHVEEISIRDEKGNSSWPEKNKEVDIDRVLSQKSYAAQQKEYFNNPLTEGSVFKQMAYKPARPLSEYKMLVCYTDPSYKDTNDYKATILVGMWQHEYHIIKCYLEQTTTAQMIQWHYNIMHLVGGCNCYYFIEEVFMQDVIRKEISDAGKREGKPIPISGDTRRKPDKFMRIESLLEPLHRNGELYFNEHERHNPHMERLAEQFIAFAPGSHAHDDGPDAVEGAIWKIIEKDKARETGSFIAYQKPVNEKSW